MKTIANIIIINSQNVKSKHLTAVIITSVFREKALSLPESVPQKSSTLDSLNRHWMTRNPSDTC